MNESTATCITSTFRELLETKKAFVLVSVQHEGRQIDRESNESVGTVSNKKRVIGKHTVEKLSNYIIDCKTIKKQLRSSKNFISVQNVGFDGASVHTEWIPRFWEESRLGLEFISSRLTIIFLQDVTIANFLA